MDFVPFAAAGLLILKLIDFLRYAANRDVNGVLTQAIVWAAGIVGVTLLAHTPWAGGIPIAGVALSRLGFWALVFYGMSVSSTSSLINDFKAAIDNSTTAALPTLFGGRYAAAHRRPLVTAPVTAPVLPPKGDTGP